MHQQAGSRIARHNCRPALAARHQGLPRGQPQSRLRLFIAVALGALLEKQRPDVLLKQVFGGFGRRAATNE